VTPKTILLVEGKLAEFSQFTAMLAQVGHYWLGLNSRPQS